MNQTSTYNKLSPNLILYLANPQSWTASVIPAVFGVTICFLYSYELSIIKAVMLVLCCILMQAAVNTFNDYFDFIKGTDTEADNLEKNDSILVNYNVNPKHVLSLAVAFLLCAAALGVFAALGSGWKPFAIGIFGGLIVVFYSAGKTPLSYLPIGEIVSGFVMGGLIPLGIVAVATSEFKPAVLICSLPFIIGIALIMMTNNTCDIEKDIAAQRKTLPILLGREKSVKIYRILIKIWRACIWILPFLTVGTVGLLSILFLLCLGKKDLKTLSTLELTPETRITCMKQIGKTNLTANGVYTLLFILCAISI